MPWSTQRGKDINTGIGQSRPELRRIQPGKGAKCALGNGSVAIDNAPSTRCRDADGEILTTDQRGEPRPGGSRCDSGAYEMQP